jgi:hypothetical protein
MNGRAFPVGVVGDFADAPGEAGRPATHGFGVDSAVGCRVISANGGPIGWLKLLFLAGNLAEGVSVAD